MSGYEVLRMIDHVPVYEQGYAIEMKSEDADKWLSALRSGEYGQTNGTLKAGNFDFCCLGVLQHVVAGDVERDMNDQPLGLPGLHWLVEHGIKFFGLNREAICSFPDPEFKLLVDGEVKNVSASCLNDNGYGFEIISDILEPLIKRV
jgi:hypothetical protein